MQCFNCAFENMPGSGRCARCGANLALATVALDVHPPRATAWQKSLPRAWWSIRRGVYHVNEWIDSLTARFGFDPDAVRINDATAIRTVVPGWAHIYSGREMVGRICLAVYGALLLPGLILTGTATGAVLVGSAFAIHIWSAVDALQTHFETLRDRLVRVAVTTVVIGMLVYFPAGWLIGRVAMPAQVGYSMPPIAAGDVIWYNPSVSPGLGDLVLHEIGNTRLNARLYGAGNAFVDLAGLRISRVVAVGGQTIAWQSGKLLVDGELSRWQPQAPYYMPEGSTHTIRDDYVFVLPDNLVVAGLPRPYTLTDQPDWFALCTIPPASVIGQVYFRSYPFSRIGFVD